MDIEERYDAIREMVKVRLGEDVLYMWEVAQIVSNLGGASTEDTINRHLKSHRLRPKEVGVNTDKIHLGPEELSLTMYPARKVWEYLQQLDKKGKIDLASRGFSSLSDILEREYHIVNLLRGSPAEMYFAARQGGPAPNKCRLDEYDRCYEGE